MMKRNVSCCVFYEPLLMGGCYTVLPIVTCEAQKIRKVSHRKKAGK